MRRFALLVLTACGDPSGNVTIALDIPNATLDPKGFSSVELALHDASGETVRSAALQSGNTFDLGDLDPRSGVMIEATLRNDAGGAVGYGRTAAPTELAANATIVVPVRRPIAYIAGVNYDTTGDWFGLPATFSDLSVGTALDGTTMVGAMPVLMVSAGPQLFAVQQGVDVVTGEVTGNATVMPISTGDHGQGAALSGALVGAVRDGAGSDDGAALVIATSMRLYSVGTGGATENAVQELATGDFTRAAMATGGAIGAIGIQDRPAPTGTCTSTAKLWAVVDGMPKMLGTGGFTDVAADGGRAFYLDGCKNELGEITATGLVPLRTNVTMLGRPTALAVSSGQAWIGVEKPGTMGGGPPAVVSLVALRLSGQDPARIVFTEEVQQVVRAVRYPGVQRRLDAYEATVDHLEIGAGGDYIGISIIAHELGARVSAANIPEMQIDTHELRVIDATSGGIVQRYRSWCDGTFSTVSPEDIDEWECTVSPGQSAPAEFEREHTIRSMTFLFGKK